MNPNDYSLREVKHARTKIALMNAFIERLRNSRFEDISIKDVCQSAEISEGTFFNYFPEKIDVITYYVNLMTMELIWKARQKAAKGRSIALLNAFFETLADDLIKINIKYELISIMIVQHERPKKAVIPDIEKHLFFPDLAGIEDISPLLIDEFFRECMEGALKNGELPGSVNIDDALVSLITIMVGTMIAIKFANTKDIKHHYRRQLQVFWTELGVKKQRG
ncbi:MAG: TetR/AcrR family transcriptional regulator [Kiritimatiellaeota bacterium]|nr:TetR/AcrR family transcriptional regulator [Kiritimatiellota bacterium]